MLVRFTQKMDLLISVRVLGKIYLVESAFSKLDLRFFSWESSAISLLGEKSMSFNLQTRPSDLLVSVMI